MSMSGIEVITTKEENRSDTVRIVCTRLVQQKSKPMFIGTISLPELKKLNLKVAEFSVRTENTPEAGYQRKVEETRARKFGKFVAEGNISPASMLLSIREKDLKHTKIDDLTRKNLNEDISNDVEKIILHVKTECPVWIVDGQHRWRGIQDIDNKKLEGFHMAFTILFGLDPDEEANQFVIINKTQKAVRTDLAERFIAKAYKKRGEIAIMNDPNTGIFKKAIWVSKAIDVLDTLVDPVRKTTWEGKVQLPNEPKAKTMTVTQSGFTNSLQVLVDKLGPLTNQDMYKVCDIVDIVDGFWNSIKKNCPKPFEAYNPDNGISPNNYAIQQTIGVSVLHRVLAMIWGDLNGPLKISDFDELLAVDSITKSDYWDRTIPNPDTDGKGGKWTMMGTNQKAFRVISDKIYSEIKETKVYKDLVAKKIGR
tara:strand:+ start:873 stop:2141 length:1269 start_codon:yes stop_codon:yes gene_type:complete